MSKGQARRTRKSPKFHMGAVVVALIIVLYAYFTGAFDKPSFETNTCTTPIHSSAMYCEHNL